MDGVLFRRAGAMIVVVDGDRVGDLLDAFADTNDVEGYLLLSDRIESERESVAEALAAQGVTIRLSRGDLILGEKDGPAESLALPRSGLSWSVGIGEDFRSAQAALASAKALGRGRSFILRGLESIERSPYEGEHAV